MLYLVGLLIGFAVVGIVSKVVDTTESIRPLHNFLLTFVLSLIPLGLVGHLLWQEKGAQVEIAPILILPVAASLAAFLFSFQRGVVRIAILCMATLAYFQWHPTMSDNATAVVCSVVNIKICKV